MKFWSIIRKLKILLGYFNPNLRFISKGNVYKRMQFSGVALDYVIKNKNFRTVLDVGSGGGKHSDIFEKEGKIVTRFDFGKSRAFTDDSQKIIYGDFLDYDFKTSYELVWVSHVLEHTLYTHQFLQKILNVGSKNAIVAITVPPAKPEFVGGHLTLWTPALLLYRMVLAGFDCSNAKVLVYGYNISVVCEIQKNSLSISDLAWDLHDIKKIEKWLPKDLNLLADGSRYGTIYKGADNYFF